MTIEMKAKIQNARAMVAKRCKGMSGYGKLFCRSMYEEWRYSWKMPTPTWDTLKKYAKEAGLVEVDFTYKWHNYGSPLCALAYIKEGTEMHATAYRFE